MEHETYRPLKWRLHTVMSERGIRTATELHRRLQPYGVDITSAQLSRIVAKMPARLNLNVLEALMSELDCEASELLVRGQPAPMANRLPSESEDSNQGEPRASESAKRKPAAKPRPVPANVLGPSVTPLITRKKQDPEP